MKNIVLNRLIIDKWKGLILDVEFAPTKTYIRGENGIGKTTLHKAFCWLLTGYCDAENNKNHELFDNRLPITSSTSAKVTAHITINGVSYEISKTAKPKFNRKGERDSSDSYSIELDGVQISATDFASWCDTMFGNASMIPYMLMGEMFINLTLEDRQKARKILEQIVGDVPAAEMLGDYSTIKEDLDRWGADMLKDRYQKMLRDAESDREKLSAIIEEKHRVIENLSHYDFISLQKTFNEISKEITEIDDRITGFARTNSVNEKRDELVRKLKDIVLIKTKIEQHLTADKQRKVIELQLRIDRKNGLNKEVDNERVKIDADKKKLSDAIKLSEDRILALNEEIETLRKDLSNAKSLVFSGDKCSYCGQELPLDLLETAKEEFNTKKQERIDSIVKLGKIAAENKKNEEKRISENKEILSSISAMEFNYEDVEDDIAALEKVKSEPIDLKTNQEYALALVEEERLRVELDKAYSTTTDSVTELTNRKNELMNILKDTTTDLAYKDMLSTEKHLLSIIDNKFKSISNDIVSILGKIEKVKEYRQERATMFADVINSRLADCSFEMFSENKNGELKPDCVVVNKCGVKYATLNNSARLKICIAMQRLFCSHFGVNMPIFVDECSIFSKGNLPQYDCQMVYLFASDDKNLSITVE
jgi:DNA repair exonuclease SbcCD ATPase subunit